MAVFSPRVFALLTLLLATRFHCALRWLLSGAPLLTYTILTLSCTPLCTYAFVSTLNLLYCVAATSSVLYYLFALLCYPVLLLSCLFHFTWAANFARRRLRNLIKESHLVHDKIALFNLPALQIDVDVDGLLVVRGITLFLSSLTLVAHGVQVVLRVATDVEIAINTNKVTVSLFRKLEIDPVYVNLKRGAFDMDVGDVADADAHVDAGSSSPHMLATPMTEETEHESQSSPRTIPRKRVPEALSPKASFRRVKAISGTDAEANEQYEAAVRHIDESSLVTQSREKIAKLARDSPEESAFDADNDEHMRAAICARLHDEPSIPHPPSSSISVTALQNMTGRSQREFMHRLPMLLRLLLNPLSHFHPITIASVTAAGSGKWIQHMLQTHVFKHYSDNNADIRSLQGKVNGWLADANFVVQLERLTADAHVPFLTSYDIEAKASTADVALYRTTPDAISLAQVVRLRGADASVVIPTFLLPHHEHLIPPKPDGRAEHDKEALVDSADGLAATVTAQQDLERTVKDEAAVKLSVRARLPAVFDQQLLDFVAALVKATKYIEMERGAEEADDAFERERPALDRTDSHSSEAELAPVQTPAESQQQQQQQHKWSEFKDNIKLLNRKMNKGMDKTWRRGIVGGMANDRWIARLVGKVTKTLAKVTADVGYSGEIPVKLDFYRSQGEGKSKLLA